MYFGVVTEASNRKKLTKDLAKAANEKSKSFYKLLNETVQTDS